MNNRQTQFSVRVNKKDFLVNAKESHERYSKLYKRFFDEPDTDLRTHNIRIMFKLERDIIRIETLINMVNKSIDEFVTVTDDIYKLIYKCDS